MITLNVKKITATAKLPIFGDNNSNNAGIDIYSDENKIIWPKTKVVISTGMIAQPKKTFTYNTKTPKWFMDFIENNFKIGVFIKSRSGLSVKKSIEHGAGTIDQDYIGEWRIVLYNHGYLPVRIKKGTRVAQAVVELLPEVLITEGLVTETDRGENGFGSSGYN